MGQKYPTHDMGPTPWSDLIWDDTDQNHKDEFAPEALDDVDFTINSGLILLDVNTPELADVTLAGGLLHVSTFTLNTVDYTENNGADVQGTGDIVCGGDVTHFTGEGPAHTHTGPLKMTTDNANIQWDAITYALPHLYIDGADIDLAGKVRCKKLTLNGVGSFHTDAAQTLVLYTAANNFWVQGTGVPTAPVIQFIADSAVTNADHVKCLPTTVLFIGTDGVANTITLEAGLDISASYDLTVYYSLTEFADYGHVIIKTSLLCRDIQLGLTHAWDRSGQLTLEDGFFQFRNLARVDAGVENCALTVNGAATLKSSGIIEGTGIAITSSNGQVVAGSIVNVGQGVGGSLTGRFLGWGVSIDANSLAAGVEQAPRFPMTGAMVSAAA